MASPGPTVPQRRLSDLQRSAFWIYGVTAMVMREPFGAALRHITDAGLSNGQVRLEVLRIIVILLLLARLFLVSGVYFETVYMQPDSARVYPRRTYPVDFLAGLTQFLIGAAVTTVITQHQRIGAVSLFMMTAAAFLLTDTGWLALASIRQFSSLPLLRRESRRNVLMVLIAAIVWATASLAGRSAVFREQCALIALSIAAGYDIVLRVRDYEALDR